MVIDTDTETKLKPLIKTKVERNLIIDLFDNYKEKDKLKSGWGFSCFIKRDEKTNILFDTSPSGEDLLFNMKEMKVDPKEIDMIFLSHLHNDHTGGLIKLLEENSELPVIIPSSFPIDFKEKIKEKGAEFKEVSTFSEIGEDIFSTGEFKEFTKEHSLIIKTRKGLIVITGCAHPGILNILNRVDKNFSEDIYLVLGGFHLDNEPQLKIENIVERFKEKKIKKVAPSHCTGDRARRLFEKNYENNYINNGAGKIINF